MARRERAVVVEARLGDRPAWYDDGVHGERMREIMAGILAQKTFPYTPGLRVSWVPGPASSARVVNEAGRIIDESPLDMSYVYLQVLCDASSPFAGVPLGGALSVGALEFLKDCLQSFIGQMGEVRVNLLQAGMDDSEAMEDETLARECMAFLAGIAPTRAPRLK